MPDSQQFELWATANNLNTPFQEQFQRDLAVALLFIFFILLLLQYVASII